MSGIRLCRTWQCIERHLEGNNGAANPGLVSGGRPARQRQQARTPHSARRRTAAYVLHRAERLLNTSTATRLHAHTVDPDCASIAKDPQLGAGDAVPGFAWLTCDQDVTVEAGSAQPVVLV